MSAFLPVKAWYLYIVITFQSIPGPLMPVEQKTVILGFEHAKECMSIANQVEGQIKAIPGVPFQLKILQCVTCKELYGATKCRP